MRAVSGMAAGWLPECCSDGRTNVKGMYVVRMSHPSSSSSSSHHNQRPTTVDRDNHHKHRKGRTPHKTNPGRSPDVRRWRTKELKGQRKGDRTRGQGTRGRMTSRQKTQQTKAWRTATVDTDTDPSIDFEIEVTHRSHRDRVARS